MEYLTVQRDPNSFQKPIPEDVILKLCCKGMNDQKVDRITELESGLFNNTYIVETADSDKVVLRVSPDPAVAVYTHESDLMRREYNIQPYLASVNHIILKIIFADFTRQLIGRDYVLQSYLEGQVWDSIKDTLTKEENESIWSQVGDISHRISQVEHDKFGFPDPKVQFDKWSGFMTDFLGGMIVDLKGYGLSFPEIEKLDELINGYHDLLDEVKTPHLIHGDLWPKNILVTKAKDRWEVTGVLDSERAYWGDPISEWIHHVMDTPVSFWDSYHLGPDSQSTSVRKRIYRGVYLVQGVLESTRFTYDTKWFLDEIRKVNEWLDEEKV